MENIINFYKQFVNEIKPFIKNQSVFDNIDNLTDEQIQQNIHTYHSSLENNETFKLFTKHKIKIFSLKSEETSLLSYSLFGETLPLKKLLNNQGEHRKNKIWEHLHYIYHLYEKENENREERLKLLKYKDISFSEKFKDMVGDNQNDKTKNFLDKIINSVEIDYENGQKGMPSMDKIIKMATDITKDFNEEFENGEIDLQGLMGNLMGGMNMEQNADINNLMGGMMGGLFGKKEEEQEQVIIDENFSTDQVELGEQEEINPALQNMLNTVNSMGLGDIKMDDLSGMMGGLGNLGNLDNLGDMEGEIDEEKMNELMSNMFGSLNLSEDDLQNNDFIKMMNDMMQVEQDNNEENEESYIEEIDDEVEETD